MAARHPAGAAGRAARKARRVVFIQVLLSGNGALLQQATFAKSVLIRINLFPLHIGLYSRRDFYLSL